MSTINNHNYNEHEHLHKHNLHHTSSTNANDYNNYKEHHSTTSNNLHHHYSNNKHESSNVTSTITSGTSNNFPYDHEWRREQYKIQRAKVGEVYDTFTKKNACFFWLVYIEICMEILINISKASFQIFFVFVYLSKWRFYEIFVYFSELLLNNFHKILKRLCQLKSTGYFKKFAL